MYVAARRQAILIALCRRRHETIGNLAKEFSVSERTIRRDIDSLSVSEPIYTQTGRHGGGVYIMENYSMKRLYFRESEANVLSKLLCLVRKKEKCELSCEETAILRNMICEYTKPTVI